MPVEVLAACRRRGRRARRCFSFSSSSSSVCGRQVARDVRQLLQLVGERGLGDHGLEPLHAVRRPPRSARSGPVSLEKAMAPFLSSRMKPVVGTLCETWTARMVSPLIDERLLGLDLDELQHRREVVGRHVKSGQVWLLKRWFFIDAIDFGDRVDAQREAGRAEVVVDEEGQRAGVVEVGVGDEDVLDLLLLLAGSGRPTPSRRPGRACR